MRAVPSDFQIEAVDCTDTDIFNVKLLRQAYVLNREASDVRDSQDDDTRTLPILKIDAPNPKTDPVPKCHLKPPVNGKTGFLKRLKNVLR